jgi:hypothetical protein
MASGSSNVFYILFSYSVTKLYIIKARVGFSRVIVKIY